jgi:HD-GYP domain-containing protein (c-di-GMP phosphodiesterase class II)
VSDLVPAREKEHFWLHLHPGHIQRMLEIIGPINDVVYRYRRSERYLPVIAKIVDTYSSFTASHSLMVGQISRTLAAYMNLPELECKKLRLPAIYTILVKLHSAVNPGETGRTERRRAASGARA